MGNVIAVIPARGGSKRIPRKNIIDFCGKPLLAWTIEAAQESGLFERILVSTDDEEIATVARHRGVDVPFLRQAHHQDDAPVSAATLAALDQARDILGETYDTVVQLMPNCPLRGSGDIATAIEHFAHGGHAFQISCFRFGWMNPWWAAKLDEAGRPEPLFPGATGKRSQDLEALYCPSGAIWIAEAAALRSAQSFYGQGHVFHPMDWKAAVDIDDEDDLDMARALFAASRRAGVPANA